MIKIHFANVLHLFRRTLLIETIYWNKSALFVLSDVDTREDLICNSRLARGCTASHANEDSLFKLFLGNETANI